MKEERDYYLGIDMGTSSVGWAVTDKKYNLLKARGKDLWGVRLFKEAETSASRRLARVSKRRRNREIARIGLLKELFSDEIHRIDSGFYQRLSESKYKIADKMSGSKNGIFADANFDDRTYYKKYPTVYHLRKELIESKNEHDIRLVFLALLSMFKNRGHFLNSNLEAESDANLETLFDILANMLEEELELNFGKIREIKELETILHNKELSRTQIVEKIAALLCITRKDKAKYEIIKAICGLKFTFSIIFGEEFFEEAQVKASVSFRDSNYDEKLGELVGQIDETLFEIIEVMKQIHDQLLLLNVKKGHEYISFARVESYEKHKSDLQKLKDVIKQHCLEKYDEIFRLKETGTYSAYVGSSNAYGRFRRNVKDRKVEDLYGTLKKMLKSCPEDDMRIKEIMIDIENDNFLPKQQTTANSVIPNQLHLVEMKAILKNAETYLPFLKETDETGLSVSKKIMALFEFQIPYYVGPLNDYHKNKGGNAWVVRNSYERIYPWNFETVIDTQKTSEVFIERLLKRCTYIKNQTVLPKNSLIYEKYMVLNELNNLRVRGEKLPISLKQELYDVVFTIGKKVTRKKLNDFLCSRGVIKKEETNVVTGVDGDFSQSLSSYGKFYAIFGDLLKQEETIQMAEQIIFWGTIYGQDKTFYKENIEKHYGDQLNENQIKRILGFKFRDWGRLSRGLLEMQGTNKSTGETLSLIQMLWHYDDNLMELFSDRYTYSENLVDENNEVLKSLVEFEYSDLNGLYLSAPVKRMVWQTVLIARELEAVLGKGPERIFVEMARGEGEKGKRTTSRKNRLTALYKSCKNDTRDWVGELDGLSENDLRSKKLYLYYMQKGKCMYSGETIELSELFNKNMYDIDHIYAQHYVKDDSLENNLVLVKKELNISKGDSYPVSSAIYERQHEFWKSLLSKDRNDGFISREKYKRLVCREPLTDEQLAGFINRQLVETRQGTKAITQILGRTLPNSEMVFVKAGNVSDFRRNFELVKSRIVNDFHHAQDAYLTIAVGNTHHVKFTKNPMQFIKQYRMNKKDNVYHMDKIFSFEVKRGNEVAWTLENKQGKSSLGIVREVMTKNTVLVTRMTYEGHGELFNATLYGAEKSKKGTYVPFKSSDKRLRNVEEYGGYSSVSTAHFFLVEHDEKGKRVRNIEALPLMLREKIGDSIELLEDYCRSELELINPSVRLNKIKLMSLVKKDGYFVNLSGKAGGQILVWNAVSLILSSKWVSYVKKVENSIKLNECVSEISKEQNNSLYDELVMKHEVSVFSMRVNPIFGVLKKGKTKFSQLSELNQCKVLVEILRTTQLGPVFGNLVDIGGSKSTGTLKINSKISSCNQFVLVNQSFTGLYRSEIDLLKI